MAKCDTVALRTRALHVVDIGWYDAIYMLLVILFHYNIIEKYLSALDVNERFIVQMNDSTEA